MDTCPPVPSATSQYSYSQKDAHTAMRRVGAPQHLSTLQSRWHRYHHSLPPPEKHVQWSFFSSGESSEKEGHKKVVRERQPLSSLTDCHTTVFHLLLLWSSTPRDRALWFNMSISRRFHLRQVRACRGETKETFTWAAGKEAVSHK